MSKIGIVLTTFKREKLFNESIKQLLDFKNSGVIDYVVSVHDFHEDFQYGDEQTTEFKSIVQRENKGVGFCKKQGLNYLLSKHDCEHIFFIEDDVKILDKEVFQHFIDFSQETNIHHTNWNECAVNVLKQVVEYSPKCKALIHKNVQGAFQYFRRFLFEDGYCEIDTEFKNAFEHVSTEYQLYKEDLIPPFWNFISPDGLNNMLKCVDQESTITNKEGYKLNYETSARHFVKKHGLFTNQIPDVPLEVVFKKLKEIKTKSLI